MRTKQCSTCREVKPVREFYKEKRGKFGVQSVCKVCVIDARKTYREANKDKIAAWREANRDKAAAWREANRDKAAAWREANKDKIAAYQAEWYEKNKEKQAEYTKANAEIMNAKSARRRAAKLQATPAWANHDKILAYYTEAKRLTTLTNTVHHVDHIVPLVNSLVCGLHCEYNLQVLTATENLNKSNSFKLDC